MNSTNFSQVYKQLNPAQKQAVDTIEGPVMVIAGPGTGKTQVLTLRIANILQQTDENPENILALTFTESGVAAMRQRLTSIIGPAAYRVNIYTFHSFANYIIQSNPENFGDLIASQPITELEQVEILEKIFTNDAFEFIKPFGDSYFYLKAAQQAIGELKKENVHPEDFAKIVEQEKQDFESIDDLYYAKGRYEGKMKGKYQQQQKDLNKNAELAKIYKMYQAELKKRQYYDFEDMLMQLVGQLETDEDLLLQLQEKYHYFLVDEHQDTNRAQNRIIELLASFHDQPNLFAVGDEKQAIYRFQGASLTNFLYLKTLYPDTQIISLTENYRSTQSILDAADSLISNSTLPDLGLPLRDKLTANTTTSNSLINVATLADHQSHYHFVAHEIQQMIEAGENPGTIAVLARANQDLRDLIPALNHQEIPFVLLAKQNILEDLVITKLLIVLQAVSSLKEEWVFKALHLDIFEIHPLDIIFLRQYAQKNKLSTLDTLAQLGIVEHKFYSLPQLTKFYQQMMKWNQQSHNQNLDEVFTAILRESGILFQTLKQPRLIQSFSKLTTLYQQLRSKMDKSPQINLSEFLSFIDLLQKHQLTISADTAIALPAAVQLMTAHGSKGLEYDHVFILGAHDGKWGNAWRGGAKFKLPYEAMKVSLEDFDTDDVNADERRLFYVALTRAKKTVQITYSQTRLDGKAQSPSQFLAEVSEELQQAADIARFDEWFAKNQEAVFATSKVTNKDVQQIVDDLKPVVADIFDKHGLSATALNNYLECPWRYFFRNMVRLPEAKTKHLIFGSAVHQTLNYYLLNLPKVKLTVKDLTTYATDYLQQQPLTKVELEEMTTRLTELLPIYYKQKISKWEADYQTELNITGVGLDPDIKLTGKLDMLIPTGKPNQFQVLDFKTGSSKSRNWILGKTQASTGDYHRQLVFYQVLMDRFLGGQMTMTGGVIEFVQPKDNGTIVSEVFSITDEEKTELEETIRRIADEIRELSFWNERCEDKDCEYCKLRDMMQN